MKDADEPEDMHFLFEPVRLPFTDEDGEQQVSCVMRHFDKKAIGQLKAAEAGKKQAEKNIGDTQKKVLDTLSKFILEAKANLAKAGRDPELARIDVKSLRQRCFKEGFITPKHWSRTFTKLVDRKFIALDSSFVSLAPLGKEVLNV